MNKKKQIPLCVDLDYTLIKTDLLFEAMIIVLKKMPLFIFPLFFKLIQGKAKFKKYLSDKIELNWEIIPLNEDVVDYCKKEKRKRPIYLVSASPKKFVDKLLPRFPFISKAYSTEDANLKSKNKAKFLINKFGFKKYSYIGDSRYDKPVWEAASEAIVVGKNTKYLPRNHPKKKLIYFNKNKLTNILYEIRLYQWAKNILIFVPFLLAHQFNQLSNWINSFIGFFSFGLLASSVYLLNDLFDIEYDRQHNEKKNRPIASGEVSINLGLILCFSFFAASIVLASYFSPLFLFILGLYLILNIFYSGYLKKIILIDVFLISFFYTLRLISGGVVSKVDISPWLMAFSTFAFFSLGFLKRFCDLLANQDNNNMHGRKYLLSDLNFLFTFGSITGIVSVLVLFQYIISGRSNVLYENQSVLWIICLVYMYWVSFLWYRAEKGEIKNDPVKFVIRDTVSKLCFGVMLFLFGLSVVL